MKVDIKTSSLIQTEIYEPLGIVLTILARIYPENQVNLAYINQVLIPAIEHNQLSILYHTDGTPVAFVIWYRLTKETLSKVEKKPHQSLHISEWNEGENLWLHNFYAIPGTLVATTKYIRDQLFKGESKLYFNRKNKTKSILLCN